MPAVLLDVPRLTRLSLLAAAPRSMSSRGEGTTPKPDQPSECGWSVSGAPGDPRPRTFIVHTAGLLACGSTPIRLAFPVTTTSDAAARIARRLQLRSQLRNCRAKRRTGFPLVARQWSVTVSGHM